MRCGAGVQFESEISSPIRAFRLRSVHSLDLACSSFRSLSRRSIVQRSASIRTVLWPGCAKLADSNTWMAPFASCASRGMPPSPAASPGAVASFKLRISRGRSLYSTMTGRLLASKEDSLGGGTAPHKSLLDIKGVGPVNASLLVANRIMSVNHLQEIYHQLCKQDAKEFQEFLHNVVGFRNSAHSRHVVDHLQSLEWEPKASRVKLAVEGNIGAGKSTFLDVLGDGSLELQDIIEIVPEPVEEWQKVEMTSGANETQNVNLLDQFYKDPKKYAYAFQHYVLLTRMQKDRNARSSAKPLQILERSIFSDRMVFVRAMHEAGFLGDLELSIYDSWFSMQIGQDRALTPDGFIYLKARPETCIKRLRHRNRSEEAGVDEKYLENLHDKHESWLHFGARQLDQYMHDEKQSRLMQTVSSLRKQGQAGLDFSPQLAEKSRDGRRLTMDVPGMDLLGRLDVPEAIRDSIVFLGNGNSLSNGEGAVDAALSGVPALVLDHEQEDILYDRDARQDYANKVMAFSDFVHSVRTATKPIDVEGSMDVNEAERLRTLLDEYKRVRAQKRREVTMMDSNLGQIEAALNRLDC
jgi:deoxyadenosine/deoxycytidine kinase